MSSEARNGNDGEVGHEAPAGAAIVVKTGFYEGLEVAIDRGWIVVGRGRSADWVIAEPTISRTHAAFGFDESGVFVEDLGSTNETQVNGVRVGRYQLADGDEIRMGKLVLEASVPH